MTRLESLKARLANATSPQEQKTIKALIATLEAAPGSDDLPQSEQLGPRDSDPRLSFLNSEQAQFWAPIILGKARCVASPEEPVDPLEDPCRRRR